VVVGLVAAAALPVTIVLAEVRRLFDLSYAAAAAPVALFGGMLAIALARRGRLRIERTLGRVGGGASAAAGRALGVIGVLAAVAAAIAVVTYVVLGRFANDVSPL